MRVAASRAWRARNVEHSRGRARPAEITPTGLDAFGTIDHARLVNSIGPKSNALNCRRHLVLRQQIKGRAPGNRAHQLGWERTVFWNDIRNHAHRQRERQ